MILVLLLMLFASVSYSEEEIVVKPIHTLQFGQICHKPEMYSIVTVRYTASMLDGKPIRNLEPQHSFQLDVNKGIKGMEKVVKDMCIDEKVQAIIPSAMAYGKEGHPDLGIPPDTDLMMEVELLDFKHGSKPSDTFSKIDENGDEKLSEVEVIEDMLLQMHIDFEFKSRNGEHARVKKLEKEVHEIGKNFLDKLDTNGDTFISRKEWSVFNHDEF